MRDFRRAWAGSCRVPAAPGVTAGPRLALRADPLTAAARPGLSLQHVLPLPLPPDSDSDSGSGSGGFPGPRFWPQLLLPGEAHPGPTPSCQGLYYPSTSSASIARSLSCGRICLGPPRTDAGVENWTGRDQVPKALDQPLAKTRRLQVLWGAILSSSGWH